MPGDIESKTVNDIANPSSRLTAITKDLVFFHGTSTEDWESIKKIGLHSLGSKYVKGGFESRGKYDLNKDIIYLATKIDGAYHYAKTRSADVMRQKMPEEWKWMQYDSECNRPIKPIVIRVRIPDVGKLRSDDDAVAGIMRKLAGRIWDAKPKEEQDRIIKELSAKTGLDVKQFPASIWRESDDGFREILNRMPQKAWKAWIASIKRHNQVGYSGFIPPSFLEPIKMCDDEWHA